MKLVPHDSRLTPAEFLRKNAGQRLAQEESLKQAGLNGYTAVVPGNPARRVAVIYQATAPTCSSAWSRSVPWRPRTTASSA